VGLIDTQEVQFFKKTHFARGTSRASETCWCDRTTGNVCSWRFSDVWRFGTRPFLDNLSRDGGNIGAGTQKVQPRRRQHRMINFRILRS
jgi:hypothetical protein